VSALIVSYGGGDNSAGMLPGLLEHGERPDASQQPKGDAPGRKG